MTLPLFQVTYAGYADGTHNATGPTGTFTDYTLDTGFLDYTNLIHVGHMDMGINFNALDLSTHNFQLTFTTLLSPDQETNKSPYGSSFRQIIDVENAMEIDAVNDYLLPAPLTSSPYIATNSFTLQTSDPSIYYYPGYDVYTQHLELFFRGYWPSNTAWDENVKGGTIQMTLRIQSLADSGVIPILAQNTIQMIIEQN